MSWISASSWRLMLWAAMLGVLVLSLLPPGTHMPSTGWDKSNHMLGFAVLALLARCGYSRAGTAWAFGGLLAYGVLIEVLQGMTSYRFVEWGDLLADGIGIVIGLVLFEAGKRVAQTLR